jgi:hypothetical protein
MKKAQREALRRDRDTANRICRENNKKGLVHSAPVPVIETRIVEPAPRRTLLWRIVDFLSCQPFR